MYHSLPNFWPVCQALYINFLVNPPFTYVAHINYYDSML